MCVCGCQDSTRLCCAVARCRTGHAAVVRFGGNNLELTEQAQGVAPVTLPSLSHLHDPAALYLPLLSDHGKTPNKDTQTHAPLGLSRVSCGCLECSPESRLVSDLGGGGWLAVCCACRDLVTQHQHRREGGGAPASGTRLRLHRNINLLLAFS